MKARYSRWDSTQDPFGGDFDVASVLDEMSDELLSGAGAEQALRGLYQRGIPGRMRGLQDLLERLREARRRIAERLNLSGPLAELRKRLDEILELERDALAQRRDEEARVREALLDALPDDPSASLKELMSYESTSSQAAGRFEALLNDLRQEVLNAYFHNLAGSLRATSPEDLGRLKDMLADLNEMVAARSRGDPYDFDGFRASYGDFFPENPRSLDELLEVMARRMAAMSRVLASLSPQQRQELAELAASVLDDLDLAFQVDQLVRSMRELLPELPWEQPAGTWGEEAMPLSAVVDAVERATEYEDLERAMAGDYAGASLEDVDEEKLRTALGEDALHDLRRLKEIERALERAGVVHRNRGRLEITARGARLLGERSLTKLLDRIRREPSHRSRGGEAEPTGQTRAWVFGDSEPISVQRTVFNAVARSGPAREVSVAADDFEVCETEARPRTATALLLDLSFSMPLRGHWIPAKRMALALNALIEGKYPQDSLYLVGFSDYARRMQPADLAAAGWEEVHGTNMQHAFMLARRLLGEDPRAIKQVIMVTDGEPTAHLEEGHALFNWPPVRATIEKTLREAARLAASNISINVYMLERSRGLIAFMDRLARLTRGRVFQAVSDELGTTVLREYLADAGGRRSS